MLGRPRWVDHLRSVVQEQPDWHGKTPSLLKTQKLAKYGGGACSLSCLEGWGRRITWTLEVEVAVSWDSATALQPGRHSKTLSETNKQTSMHTHLRWQKTALRILAENWNYICKKIIFHNWTTMILLFKLNGCGQVQWLMPIIPELWEAEVGGSPDEQIETILANKVKPHLY